MSQFGRGTVHRLNSHLWWGATVPACTDLKREYDQTAPEPEPCPDTSPLSRYKVPMIPSGMKSPHWPAPPSSQHPSVPRTPSNLSLCQLLACLGAVCLKGSFPIYLKTSYTIYNTPSASTTSLSPQAWERLCASKLTISPKWVFPKAGDQLGHLC